MGFGDIDFKEIMKQAGKALELGDMSETDRNTFLANSGKAFASDWKIMMGKGKKSVPDWNAIAKESFGKKKKGKKNKKSEEEILEKCAEYAQKAVEGATLSTDVQGAAGNGAATQESTGSGAAAQEDAKKSRRLSDDALRASKTTGSRTKASDRKMVGRRAGVSGMKASGMRSADGTSYLRTRALGGSACEKDMEGIRAAVRTADAERMREAIVWSEILGEPVSVRRRKKRMNH